MPINMAGGYTVGQVATLVFLAGGGIQTKWGSSPGI